MKKILTVAMAIGLLAGCASAPKLPNSQTANEQFSALGYHDKWVAKTFYDLGAGDSVRRLYWAQRASQQHGGYSEASPAEKLQRRYINVPIPAHIDPDGTEIEASTRAVEIVQLWRIAYSHGRPLFLVK